MNGLAEKLAVIVKRFLSIGDQDGADLALKLYENIDDVDQMLRQMNLAYQTMSQLKLFSRIDEVIKRNATLEKENAEMRLKLALTTQNDKNPTLI